MTTNNYLFTSESVSEGHPDKVSDRISDMVVDTYLSMDPVSRVACETLVKSNCVTIAGEITTNSKFDYEQVVRDAIRKIGYINDDDIFHYFATEGCSHVDRLLKSLMNET